MTTGKSSTLLDRDLVHFEQSVNDRRMTSSAPGIDEKLLPENGCRLPLRWRRLDKGSVSVFQTKIGESSGILSQVTRDGLFLMPVHPLEEVRFAEDEFLTSGHIQFSASYRTVFFEPEAGGVLDEWVPDGQVLMIKLHLQNPLPGIEGDRRLTRDKVEKCVLLSELLPEEVGLEPMSGEFEIIPEFMGMSHPDGGVLYRLLLKDQVIPLFGLYSQDRTNPELFPIVVRHMASRFSGDSQAVANVLGSEVASPLIRSLLSGFRRGFSLEMHAQNTLVRVGVKQLLERVYFRDIEGVVLSDSFRMEQGLAPLFPDTNNTELVQENVAMHRWFNRNVDHDLGRVFSGIVDCLRRYDVLQQKDVKFAIRSIQRSVRANIDECQLSSLSGSGRYLPFSRSPYGNGMRLGHYYSTRFR